VQWIVKQIDNGTYTKFTEVADAMFSDKKLNKLLRSQYSAEKLARKQALVYVFGGCLEGQSPTEFLANSDNYDRTLERMKRAYASVQNFTSRAVESKFGSHTIRKAIGQA
jgi:DNA-binding transcriptional MocR family regulator